MENQRVLENVETPINENQFHVEGYGFTGWNTKRDGSGTSYSDGAQVTDIANTGETITLLSTGNLSAYLATLLKYVPISQINNLDFELLIQSNI